MSQQSYICEFKEEHIDEAARVLCRAFLHLNGIWKKYNPKYQEIFSLIRGKIIPAVGSGGMSFVLMLGSKIIDYLQMPEMPTELVLFRHLAQAGSKLQAQLDLSNIKRGDALYGLYAVMDPDYARSGHSLKFWWHQLSVGRCVGWKYYYSRISNPVSLKQVKKFGGEELAQVLVEGTDDSQKIWMIRLQFKNLPPYSVLEQFANMKQKPKL